MKSAFTPLQKIKMGFGGFFLAFIPAAIITAVLFTHFAESFIWIIFSLLMIGGFFCGMLMLSDSKLPKIYFLSITAISIFMAAVSWIF